MQPDITKIKNFVDSAKRIVIIQADNPDGDSLSSALALEHIFGDMGKEPILYCGVDIPGYLRYMEGWDRVSNELPAGFDASIIVDTGSLLLLETLQKSGKLSWLAGKPCMVLDHHKTESTISFATIAHCPEAAATGEAIYELACELEWPLNLQARQFIATAIMADSLGLISEGASARTIHIIAELVEDGVSLASLEKARRSMQKKSPELLTYKGHLLERVEYHEDQRIAMIIIPWPEIEKYSHQYNPSMLVIDEMRMVEKVAIAIAIKLYPGGRITGKIRANHGFGVADKLAEHFGGGGHIYASGFRVTDGRNIDDVKVSLLSKGRELLDNIYNEKLSE